MVDNAQRRMPKKIWSDLIQSHLPGLTMRHTAMEIKRLQPVRREVSGNTCEISVNTILTQ